jgi:hypothetical protein
METSGQVRAGQSVEVTLRVPATSLAVVEPLGRQGWALQPCSVTVYAGGRQPAAPAPHAPPAVRVQRGGGAGADIADTVQSASLRVVGPVQLIKDCHQEAAQFVAK